MQHHNHGGHLGHPGHNQEQSTEAISSVMHFAADIDDDLLVDEPVGTPESFDPFNEAHGRVSDLGFGDNSHNAAKHSKPLGLKHTRKAELGNDSSAFMEGFGAFGGCAPKNVDKFLDNLEASKAARENAFGILEKYLHHARIETGPVTTYSHEAGGCQFLGYNVKNLVQWGGLGTMWATGTVFTMDVGVLVIVSIVTSMFGLMTIGLIVCNEKDVLAALEIKQLEDLSQTFNILVPLVLGLYVSVELTRWWALRVDAIGALFDAIVNVCMISACVLPGEKFARSRELVTKWSMASIILLIKAARYKEDFDDIHLKGLLSRDEFHRLEDYDEYSRAMIMWCWILRLLQESFVYARGPLPLAVHVDCIEEVCESARNGIQTVHTYLQTQLPFAYVHLITVIVNVNTFIVCVKSSVVGSIAYATGSYERFVKELITLLLVTTLYQGLLSISYVIHDPFGEDSLDFPLHTFTEYVARITSDVLKAQESYPGTPGNAGFRARAQSDGMGGVTKEMEVVNAAVASAVVEAQEFQRFANKLASQFDEAASNVAQLRDAIADAQWCRSSEANALRGHVFHDPSKDVVWC